MDTNIYVTQASLPPFEEYIQEISDIWQSRRLTNMGEKHIKLSDELKAYLDVDNIELLSNGHMALELSLQALKLEGEVITTPFTFASTTHSIVRNGLKPVFCDIKASDFTIDETKIEALITDRTTAIVPVHVYGNICNVEVIESIAKKHNLKVIYDAAHSFGERYKNKTIGNFGDVSCFSFHATKVFNTIEGGAACFRDKELGLEIYRLKNFGIRGPEVVDGIGANAKMNEFAAAMGICNLRHISEQIAKRKVCYERYMSLLQGVEGVCLNPLQEGVESNYSYFPIVFYDEYGISRDEVYDKLAKQSIYARKYFYPLTNMFDCYSGMYDASQTPVAVDISKRVLTLPLYADLDCDVIDKICKIIREK